MSKFYFADITMELCFPDDYIDERFKSFSVEEGNADIIVVLSEDELTVDKNMLKVSYPDECDFYASEDIFYVTFSQMRYVPAVKMHLVDLKYANITVYLSGKPNCNCDFDEFRDEIFDVIRCFVFSILQQRGKIVLHSASLVYDEKVYAFSAFSGVGKSTHTNKWTKLFDCAIFNGDVTALGMCDGKVMAYGLPWCGASHLSLNKQLPLGGLVFLFRGKKNFVSPMDEFNAISNMLMHCLTMNLTADTMSKNADVCTAIVQNTPCACLNCLPDDDSVYVMREYIDKHMKFEHAT